MDTASTIPHDSPLTPTMRPPDGEPNRGAEQLAFFSPPPAAVPLLLELLTDSSHSLLDIALSAHTSLEALAAWMTQPDIAQRLDDLHTLAARRARLVAAQHLAAAATALGHLLTASDNPAENAALDTANPRHLALRLRQRESTRRTAATLLRIANHTPRRTAATSAPGGADVPSAHFPHREAVQVSSRGLPRSGTPGVLHENTPSPPGLNAPEANLSPPATAIYPRTRLTLPPATDIFTASRATDSRGSASESVPINSPVSRPTTIPPATNIFASLSRRLFTLRRLSPTSPPSPNTS
ncbi:MAG: hypothetical protein ACKVS8_09835 [Phycisphaerales bacterium]